MTSNDYWSASQYKQNDDFGVIAVSMSLPLIWEMAHPPDASYLQDVFQLGLCT